jgi:hypothetical protein
VPVKPLLHLSLYTSVTSKWQRNVRKVFNFSAMGNRKWCEVQAVWWCRYGIVQQADKQVELVISGLFFFGSFLLEEQKK